MLKFVEIVATAFTLIGLYFVSEGQAIGFTLGLIGNLAWIYYGHEKNETGILIVNAVILLINLKGLNVI